MVMETTNTLSIQTLCRVMAHNVRLLRLPSQNLTLCATVQTESESEYSNLQLTSRQRIHSYHVCEKTYSLKYFL